ncbi:collagen alpha-1(I) chain-like isoform X4 [Pipra filicauda]|uniref:Collagen alpha-1(I) chain-like isoform X4 n=1 Tax=Pipra filicauda TaxID=649802 RepID=A0A7R5L6P7_9PASS|nr:collagen alpha-1(I) chain-like isoform X4 [Pipra filicauda]
MGFGSGTGIGIAGVAAGWALGPSSAGPLGPGLCRGPVGGERRRFPRTDAEPGPGPAGVRGHAGPAPGPPDPAGPAAPPAPPAGSELLPLGHPRGHRTPPRRTSPASLFPAAPGGSRPQGPPGTRALGPAGAPATDPLRPRGAGALPGQGRTGAAAPSFLPCSGTPSRAARLSPCPCVCPQAAPGAGADRAAGRAQAAPSSACGTSAIAPSSSLPCHPEGAAPLTPARRGRSCLGGKRLQERKPRNAQPDAAARVKGGKDRRIHPMVAKVLVQRLFPGINEPNKPRGILCSEAKALVECRRLVPPAGGRLLQFPREKNRNSQPPRPDSPLQPELSTQPERQFQHLKGKKRTKKVIYFVLKLL